MNVLENNRDNYLRGAGSKRRIVLIVLGVAAAHVVVISGVASWRGWMPKIGEGLIRVSIVPAGPHAAPKSGVPSRETPMPFHPSSRPG